MVVAHPTFAAGYDDLVLDPAHSIDCARMTVFLYSQQEFLCEQASQMSLSFPPSIHVHRAINTPPYLTVLADYLDFVILGDRDGISAKFVSAK